VRRAFGTPSNLGQRENDRAAQSVSIWQCTAGPREPCAPFNALREVARIGERCEARSIGHYHLEAARMTRSIAHRREAAARNMAQEAARNTRTGQGRSGDRQRNRIRRRGQQKAVGP
jgi:hypothetical protein